MRRVSLVALACLALAACGGGAGASSNTATVPQTLTLEAGQSATISDGMVAMVPSGTTATTPRGGALVLAGDNSSLTVPSGTVVSVPASATGPADDVLVATESGASVMPSANVSLIAGSATTNLAPVDGTGGAAVFWGGGTISVMPDGTLIVSDRAALREVTQAGVVTTIEAVGQPIAWQGVAVDAAGNIFASGAGLDPSTGVQTSLFVELPPDGTPSVLGASLPASGASVGFGGLAVDGSDTWILADSASNRILRFKSGAGTTVLAGSGQVGSADGTGAAASFDIVADTGLALDAVGDAYLLSDGAIRKVTPQGVVTTIAQGLPVRYGPIAMDAAGAFYIGLSATLYKVDARGTTVPYAQLGTSDFITALATDASGHLYVGTRGVGAQIFKVTAQG
jgi:hypothetical protein